MKNNAVRIVCISDTHGLHHEIENKFGGLPEGDILIHAGDVSNIGDLWDIERFLNWFSIQPFDHKIFVAGNHDWGFERERHTCISIINELNEKEYNIHYLEDSGVEIEGLKFWGTPVTNPFMNWAFNVETDKRIEHWNIIPDDTDILITHSPPYGICDLSTYGHEHVGCPYLLYAIKERIKPKLHVFGHVHSAYGIEEHEGITYVNASVLNERYGVDVKQPPILLDI